MASDRLVRLASRIVEAMAKPTRNMRIVRLKSDPGKDYYLWGNLIGPKTSRVLPVDLLQEGDVRNSFPDTYLVPSTDIIEQNDQPAKIPPQRVPLNLTPSKRPPVEVTLEDYSEIPINLDPRLRDVREWILFRAPQENSGYAGKQKLRIYPKGEQITNANSFVVALNKLRSVSNGMLLSDLVQLSNTSQKVKPGSVSELEQSLMEEEPVLPPPVNSEPTPPPKSQGSTYQDFMKALQSAGLDPSELNGAEILEMFQAFMSRKSSRVRKANIDLIDLAGMTKEELKQFMSQT